MKKTLTVLIFLMVFCMTASIAMADDNNLSSPDKVVVGEIKAFDPEVDKIYNQVINDKTPQYVLKTSIGNIPVFVNSPGFSCNKITTHKMEIFINGAIQSAKDDLKTVNVSAIDEYEFISIESDATYIYCHYPERCYIMITPTGESVQLNKETQDNEFSVNAGSYFDLPKGIGGRAITYSTSTNNFSGSVTSANLNYADSTPDNGQEDDTKINFFNYLGITGASVEGDLGLIWSNTYQGWRPYYRLVQNGTTYVHNINADTIEGSLSYLFKATLSYPTTISVDKNYTYNQLTKVKLTISGTRTNMSNGITSIVAGNGITTSIKYKALTTVAVGEKGKESDIKTGTRVDSTYSNIKIGNNPVTTYESVQYDNTTIPSFYPDLIYNVKKQ